MENEAEDDKEDPSNVEVLPDDEDQEPEARMKEMAGRMRIGLCKAWPEAMSQAKLDQNDGFMRALAWPSILQSQSQAVRLQLLQAMDRIIKL